jgi:hypothetical protein
MLRVISLLIVLYGVTFSQQSEKEWAQQQNIPPEIIDAFNHAHYDSMYTISFHINPFYLRGDFNGDNIIDCAVLVKNKSTGTIGIAIVDGRKKSIIILGAGKSVRKGLEDFNWMDAWYVFPKGPTYQGTDEAPPPKLIGDALWVAKLESSSAFIYWSQNKYLWYQTGD